jgi:cytochrome c55X
MRIARRSAVALVSLLPVTAAASDPADQRQAELLHLLKHDCGSCHGLTMKGGLGPALLPQAIGEKDDEVLVETILNGRPGTPMPSWRFELSAAEAAWMVRALKAGLAP